MSKRIDKLTDEQKSHFDEHADKWIAYGLNTEPADFDQAAEGIKACYEFAGIPWHGNVVRVSSPIVMAFAGPAASLELALLASRGAPTKRAVGEAVRGAVGEAVDEAVRGAVRGAVDGAVDGAVGEAVGEAVREAVDGAVGEAVGGAVGGAVDEAVGGAVRGAVSGAVSEAVSGAVDKAVSEAVRGAVSEAVGGAVRGAVSEAVGGAVREAVRGAVRGAVDGPLVSAGESIDHAFDGAYKRVLADTYYQYTGGYWTYWAARNTFFRDFTDLELNGNMWDRSRAFEQTIANAGWWWPHKDFVMVCDRPKEIHREQVVGPRGWNSHRLHNERGPAISWRDGWALYFVHGVRVTEQIVMRPETLTAAQILKEPNAEVRRVMCEKMGWDRFVEEAGLRLIDECDDPANFPNKLSIYDTPEQVLGVPVRVLLCANATPERDGTIRRFGLTVPAEIKTAMAAAAWTFGMTETQYKELARAT